MQRFSFRDIVVFIVFGTLAILLFSFSLAVVLALCVMGGVYLLYLRYILPWWLSKKVKKEQERVFDAEYTIVDDSDKPLK